MKTGHVFFILDGMNERNFKVSINRDRYFALVNQLFWKTFLQSYER